MPVDEMRLCRVFSLWECASFLGLLVTISERDTEIDLLIHGDKPEDCLKPALQYRIQWTRKKHGKVEHGEVTARFEDEVADHGSDSRVIGTEYQPHSKNREPTESRLSGEAGFKKG